MRAPPKRVGQVLGLIRAGKSYGQIGTQLRLSPRTVALHATMGYYWHQCTTKAQYLARCIESK